jgi:tetratricopeptide (TPR) repeat protein
MRYCLRLLIGVVAVGLFAEFNTPADSALFAESTAGVATRPADKPLDAKALIPLDKLKPAVSKPASSDSPVPRRAQKAVDKAKVLIADGKYALAVPLLVERALGFAPNSAEVHRLLADAYMKLPDPGKALVHMRKALELNGDSISAQIKLAQLLIAQKQSSQATVALRTAMACSQSKPENPLTGEALLRLGKLLEQAGYLQAAMDCFEALSDNIDEHGRSYASRPLLRSVVLRPQRLWARRGELHARLRQPAKATPLLKRAFSRDRTNAKLAGLIVESLAASKQFKEAEAFLVDLAGRPLLRTKLPELASRTAVASGDKAMPLRIWKACRAAKRDSGALAVYLARAAEKLGAPDQGSAILQSALDSKPGDAAVTKFIVALYVSQRKFDKVLESLAKLLIADPSRDDLVSRQLADLGRSDIPKDLARKFAGRIASAPKDQRAPLHYITGRTAMIQGGQALALEQYGKAVKADPAFLPTYAHLAGIYAAKDQKDQLAALLKQIDKLPGGQESVAYYYARGKVLLAMSQIPQAEKSLQSGLKIDPRHLPTLEALGDLLLVVGRARDAAIAFRRAAVLNPNSRSLNKRLFEAYMALRAFRDARELAEKAVQRDPESSDAKIMLVRVLVASGRHAEAMKFLGELKTKFSDDPRVALLLVQAELAGGGSVMFKKDFDRVVASLEKIIGSDKSNSDALFELARIMMRNGQYARAHELWARVLKTRKNDAVQRASIETMMALGKYSTASAAIRKMMAVLPNDPILRGRLITCLKLDGKAKEACDVLKQWLSQATDADKAVTLRFEILNSMRTAKLYDSAQTFMNDWLLVDHLRVKRIIGWKASTFLIAEKPAEAITYAEKLLAGSPRNHPIKVVLITALTKTKAYSKAHGLLDKWISEQIKKPDNTQISQAGMPLTPQHMIGEYQGLKAGLYVSAGKLDQADAYAASCIKKDPGNIRVRLGLVSAFEETKEYDKALTRLDAWIKSLSGAKTPTTKPSGDSISNALKSCRAAAIGILATQKAYDKVIKRADECLKTDPTNLLVLSWRASALNETGHPDKALADIRKIHTVLPSLPLYKNNLGYQLADMGLELIEAERLIRQALAATRSTSRDYLAPVDSLSWVF